MQSADEIRARARRLKLMAFDVDGVLTDGALFFTDDGIEIKAFNSRDGLGLKMLQKAGISVAIITGRKARCVEWRMQNLGIDLLYQGIENKWETMQILLDRLGIGAEEAGDERLRLFGHSGRQPCPGQTSCPTDFKPGRRPRRGA